MSQVEEPRTPTEFAEYHELNLWLLPFEHRKNNAIEILRNIQGFVKTLPQTRAHTDYREILEALDLEYSEIADYKSELMYAGGLWVLEDYARNDRMAIINPNYVHKDSLVRDREYSIDDRKEITKRYLKYGHKLRVPARRIGLTKKGLWSCADKKGWLDELKTWRREGRKRHYRTLETIHKWSDFSFADLAEAFGLEKHNIQARLRSEVGNDKPIPEKPGKGFPSYRHRMDEYGQSN